MNTASTLRHIKLQVNTLVLNGYTVSRESFIPESLILLLLLEFGSDGYVWDDFLDFGAKVDLCIPQWGFLSN